MRNFVFALFRSGNATAVGYNSASGQWGVKNGEGKMGSAGWGVKEVIFRVKRSVWV